MIRMTTMDVTDCLCALINDGCSCDPLGYCVTANVSTKMNCLEERKSINSENNMYMVY